MKTLLSALAICALPVTAGAASIDQATLAPTGDDITITLHGTSELRALRTRTAPGLIKVWFSLMGDSAPIDRRGGDTGIAWLRVRSGANDTGLVQISLTDPRMLDPNAIRLEANGDTARIRIARALLPAVPPAAPAPEAEDAALAGSPSPQPSPPAGERGSEAAAAGERGSEARRSRPWARAARAEATPASKLPGVGVLAFMALLCGGAFVGLKMLAKHKKAQNAVPEVEILSARRLGPKHQLVIVRAFGRDMLLSVGNNSTQRIASVKSGTRPSTAEPRGPVEPTGRRDATGGRAGKLGADPGWAPGRLVHRTSEDGGSFGRELVEAARSITRPSDANHDSISGLLRLRELREQASK